jgi:hypothetical protein
MAKQSTHIQKTRKGGLYTCYARFKDYSGDKTVPGEVYKLAKKCEYTSGKVSYIMLAKTFGVPTVMISEKVFAKYFVPTNSK